MSGKVDEAIKRAENSAPAGPQPFVVRVTMGEGREAVVMIPGDTTDSELLHVVGILTGPARTELAGHRARADVASSGRIVVPGRGILRPI